MNDLKQEMHSVCQILRNETMAGFDELKKLKESKSITDADLDYALARDRKAMIALRTIVVELNIEKISGRRITT